eukprot:Em0004g255a
MEKAERAVEWKMAEKCRLHDVECVKAWASVQYPLSKGSGHVAGDNGEGDFPNEGHVVKDSDNCFTVWCTGRTGCDWMMAQLRLQRRQDLFTLLLSLVRPSPDTVKNYSTIVRTKDLDSSLMVISDSSEAVILLLSNQIVAFLNKNASSVEYIHLSDLYTGAARDRECAGQSASKLASIFIPVWLELLSALAFDGMTPSSVPLYGGGGGMTPSSVPLYGGGGGMTPSSVPLYGGGGGMTPSSVPLYGGGDGMTPVTSAQNLQSFVQFALSLLDHIKSIRLT